MCQFLVLFCFVFNNFRVLFVAMRFVIFALVFVWVYVFVLMNENWDTKHKHPIHSLTHSPTLWHLIQLHLWFWLLTAFKIYKLPTRHSPNVNVNETKGKKMNSKTMDHIKPWNRTCVIGVGDIASKRKTIGCATVLMENLVVFNYSPFSRLSYWKFHW